MEALIGAFKSKWNVNEWNKGWFFEENIYDINTHWMKFDPPKRSSFTILAVMYTFIMIIGFTGNLVVILLFVRNKSLRTSANTLIVNLAVSDGLMMCEMPLLIYNSCHSGPVLGNIACRIYGFIGGLSGTVSIVTLASISFDRYFVITYPLRRKFTKIRIRASVICAWVYGLTFSSIQLFDIGFGKYQYEGYLVSCSFDYLTESRPTKIFIMVFFVAAWVIPFNLITFCYLRILHVVKRRPFGSHPKRESFRHTKEELQRKQDVKLATIVLGVIFLWTLSWTPYSVISLFGITGRKDLITPVSSMIPALFCKTASAIDPYVYAVSHPKFREHLVKMFTGTRPRQQKIWSCELTKSTRVQDLANNDNVEEELIDVEVNVDDTDRVQYRNTAKQDIEFTRQQSSNALMICFRPSFSNRTSSLRRISRTLSAKTAHKSRSGDE
ncbi:hypothetical protein GWI33_008751 [Rhynchophorus ferrugineus]|uniref:G-protein coupled receptors family 1 profile domain-containing protein n=1 Tax=Rhynchophorus ferrugineus TaxID=354439 RepID=A0A834IEA2_RHYFE|nr:hypothetical protein GWI33_008751 [Rhynchophorus ferrugineus]